MGKDFPVHVGAQMADAGGDESQVRRCRPALQFMELFLMLFTVYGTAGAAEFAVHRIHILNETGQFALIHIIVQVSAVFGGKGQLAIGKGTGPTPAGYDIRPPAGRGSHAVFIQGNPFPDIQALFQNQDGQSRICQFQCRENSRRAGTDNNYIIGFSPKNTPFDRNTIIREKSIG